MATSLCTSDCCQTTHLTVKKGVSTDSGDVVYTSRSKNIGSFPIPTTKGTLPVSSSPYSQYHVSARIEPSFTDSNRMSFPASARRTFVRLTFADKRTRRRRRRSTLLSGSIHLMIKHCFYFIDIDNRNDLYNVESKR